MCYELGTGLVIIAGLSFYGRRLAYHAPPRRDCTATSDELTRLPGIGPNTAGAIRAYAYNQPAVFIETNVRTVFIYHFFPKQGQVSDKAVLELVRQTLTGYSESGATRHLEGRPYLVLGTDGLRHTS
jgi:A/G-specific adenine glycosylase